MELTAEKRDISKNTNTLRREGVIPAVIYGRGEDSTPIALNRKEFDKVFKKAGESTVIKLSGLGTDKDVLIHDVDTHPVTGETLHADFYAIQKGQKVTVSVPLEFEGVSPAVKDLGGILTKVMHELEVECEPSKLPHAITVDISKLVTLEDQLKIADLGLPADIIPSEEAEEVVAMISVAQDEPVDAPAADISSIEISEERGKKEEEAAPEGTE